MKRLLVILLVIQLLFLSACSIPFFGKKSAEPSALAEGQKMLQLPENSQQSTTPGGITGMTNDTVTGLPGGTSGGAVNGTISSSAFGVTNGAAGETASNAAIGMQDSVTSVAGISTTGSAFQGMQSVTTDAAIASSVSSNDEFNENTEAFEYMPEDSYPEVVESVSENSANEGNMFAEDRQPVTVYYQDKDGYLIPLTRWIPMQQGIARAAVSLNIDSAMTREELAYYGVYPVLPEDTVILGIDVRDNVAAIDFDRHLLNYGNAVSERNIVASIVYTMTEFKTIEKVRILINGYEPGVLKYGTDISKALGRDDIAINADASVVGTGKADIFLLKQANIGFTYLVPVSVGDTDSAGDLPGFLVRQLLSVDPGEPVYNEMPYGVELLKWDLSKGVLSLDFSGSFVDYGGNSKEEGILKQLAYTVKQIEGVRRLKIFVEGSEAELPEGTDISAGLAIPATINDVIDR